MEILLIILLTLIFLAITIQDFRERQVFWFLFPCVGILSGLLFYNRVIFQAFISSVSLNLLFISILLAALWLYTKIKMQTTFKNSIGLGDILLFYALAFSFATIAFMYILIAGLLFALIAHIITKQFTNLKTIPLAGYLSLFFAVTFLIGYKANYLNYLYAV